MSAWPSKSRAKETSPAALDLHHGDGGREIATHILDIGRHPDHLAGLHPAVGPVALEEISIVVISHDDSNLGRLQTPGGKAQRKGQGAATEFIDDLHPHFALAVADADPRGQGDLDLSRLARKDMPHLVVPQEVQVLHRPQRHQAHRHLGRSQPVVADLYAQRSHFPGIEGAVTARLDKSFLLQHEVGRQDRPLLLLLRLGPGR